MPVEQSTLSWLTKSYQQIIPGSVADWCPLFTGNQHHVGGHEGNETLVILLCVPACRYSFAAKPIPHFWLGDTVTLLCTLMQSYWLQVSGERPRCTIADAAPAASTG